MSEYDEQTDQEEAPSAERQPQSQQPVGDEGQPGTGQPSAAGSGQTVTGSGQAVTSSAGEGYERDDETAAPPEPTAGGATETGRGEDRAPLLPTEQAEPFRQRWENLQARFVDRPRETVEEADGLVAELMQQLTAGFSDERTNLEEQWERGDEVSTEDLRVVLTRYRSFFNRLLSA